MSNDWFCGKCFGSHQPGPSQCDCPRECQHDRLDDGPCDCYDRKRKMPKTDRCSSCCGKCNSVYRVWINGAERYNAEVKAESPAKARQLGYGFAQNAGLRGVTFTDIRVRRMDKILVKQ